MAAQELVQSLREQSSAADERFSAATLHVEDCLVTLAAAEAANKAAQEAMKVRPLLPLMTQMNEAMSGSGDLAFIAGDPHAAAGVSPLQLTCYLHHGCIIFSPARQEQQPVYCAEPLAVQVIDLKGSRASSYPPYMMVAGAGV